MRLSIDVKDKKEREALRVALEDSEVRAFVVCVGVLMPYSDRARGRMLQYVADAIADYGGGPVSVRMEHKDKNNEQPTMDSAPES